MLEHRKGRCQWQSPCCHRRKNRSRSSRSSSFPRLSRRGLRRFLKSAISSGVSLADSPLTDEDNREVSQTVFRALLDAAGPTGTIQVSFRIFPDQVEVDVLHSHSGAARRADPGTVARRRRPGRAADRSASPRASPSDEAVPATFAEWMSAVLRREGLTQEAAARQLGVSVKTVGRWVGGDTEPRMRDLRRIQERFGEMPLL